MRMGGNAVLTLGSRVLDPMVFHVDWPGVWISDLERFSEFKECSGWEILWRRNSKNGSSSRRKRVKVLTSLQGYLVWKCWTCKAYLRNSYRTILQPLSSPRILSLSSCMKWCGLVGRGGALPREPKQRCPKFWASLMEVHARSSRGMDASERDWCCQAELVGLGIFGFWCTGQQATVSRKSVVPTDLVTGGWDMLRVQHLPQLTLSAQLGKSCVCSGKIWLILYQWYIKGHATVSDVPKLWQFFTPNFHPSCYQWGFWMDVSLLGFISVEPRFLESAPWYGWMGLRKPFRSLSWVAVWRTTGTGVLFLMKLFNVSWISVPKICAHAGQQLSVHIKESDEKRGPQKTWLCYKNKLDLTW